MVTFKKGDVVSLKGSKAPHIIDVVSTSKRAKEKLTSLQTYYCYVYRELEHRQILKVQ